MKGLADLQMNWQTLGIETGQELLGPIHLAGLVPLTLIASFK